MTRQSYSMLSEHLEEHRGKNGTTSIIIELLQVINGQKLYCEGGSQRLKVALLKLDEAHK